MLSNIGFTEFLLIVVVALLLFGPQKLPEIGRALGRTMQEFKKGMQELTVDTEEAGSLPPTDTGKVDLTQSNSSHLESKYVSREAKNNLPE